MSRTGVLSKACRSACAWLEQLSRSTARADSFPAFPDLPVLRRHTSFGRPCQGNLQVFSGILEFVGVEAASFRTIRFSFSDHVELIGRLREMIGTRSGVKTECRSLDGTCIRTNSSPAHN